MLDKTSSIICAFGLASAAPRLPYRHLELCGIAFIILYNFTLYPLLRRDARCFSPTVDCCHARHGADSAWFALIFYCVYIIIKLFYCLIFSIYQLSNFISLPQRMCYYWQKIQLYQNLPAMGGCSSVVPCWGYWCLCWCSGSAHWM